MTPVETLLAKLPDAKRAGNSWSSRCPAHDDRRASLSVSEGDDGTALVKCHAGCDTSAVLADLRRELAPQQDDMPEGSPGLLFVRLPCPKKGGGQ